MNKQKYWLAFLIVSLFSLPLWGIWAVIQKPADSKISSDLKTELKKQLLMEMESEIQKRVEQEVQLRLASFQSSSQGQETQSMQKFAHKGDLNTETKQDAMQRVVREIVALDTRARPLTEEELDETTASSLDFDTYLPGGYQKPQHDFLITKSVKDGQKAKEHKELDSNWLDSIYAGQDQAESLERTVAQKGGMLLPKGTLQVEPSLTYAESSANSLTVNGFSILPVLVIGDITITESKRNVFIYNLSAKYSVLNNLQAEIRLPYRYEHDRITRTAEESVTTLGGIGDVEVGLSRQIFWEKGWLPDTVANVSFKTRTGEDPYNNTIGIGNGHYAARGGLVMVKSSDPAVIFGSVNYAWNIKRDNIPNFGDVDPGDSVGFSLGAAIALSYQTAINFSYDQSVTFKQTLNNVNLVGSFINTASVKTGFTWALNESTSIDFSAGIGVTSDTPDITVTLRVPHTF